MRFRQTTRSLSLGAMAAVLAIGLAGPVGAQPPPGTRFGPGPGGPGPFVAGALLGFGAAALVGAAVAPPPPPVYVVPPPPYPYPYYVPPPPRRVYYPSYYYGYPQY
jgi:hypothetical protein